MKKTGLLLLMCGLLVNCGGSGSGGTPLTPLTEDQKQEVLKVSSSMGDMSSVEERETGNPTVNVQSREANFQGYASRAVSRPTAAVEGDTDFDGDSGFGLSEDRMDEIQRHLEETAECEPQFQMEEPNFESESFAMSFALAMGNEQCGIALTSNFDMNFDVKQTTPTTGSVSMAVNFDTAFKAYREFQDDFDVTEFELKGSMAGSGQGTNESYNFSANGNFDGKGVSKEKGDFQFQISANSTQNASASGSVMTERAEVKYIFTDYTAVLVQEGTQKGADAMVYKYFLNGVEVDQDDPEAMKEFQTMAGSIGVPGTPVDNIGADSSMNTSDEYDRDNYGRDDEDDDSVVAVGF